jgi:PAS domain S-box-containing protein
MTDKKLISDTSISMLMDRYTHILGGSLNLQNTSLEEIVAHIVQYYEDILNCMPGNVYWFDQNCVCIGCNQNVLDMFGFKSMDEFKGLTFEQMGRIGNWSKLAEQSFKRDTEQVIASGKPKLNIEEPPINNVNGKTIYFLSSRVPLKNHDGKVIGIVGISIDITEIRQARETLKKEKQQAETLVKFQLMNEALQKAEHKLEGMTLVSASLAHELRTPLRTIHSVANGIKDYLPHLIKAYEIARKNQLDVPEIDPWHLRTLTEICEIIESETRAAFMFINMALMNLNQDVDNKKDFAICSIKNCIQEALNRYPFDEREKELVNCDIKTDFNFFGNHLLIVHIIFNLLKNAFYAIKEARKGEVFISTEADENYCILRFKDTAKGIAPATLPHIFERFFSQTYHGAGIGLTFCKMVMQNLGGDIRCLSEENQYTEFLLCFPKY